MFSLSVSDILWCPAWFKPPRTVCVNSSAGLTATAPSATSSPACSTSPVAPTAMCWQLNLVCTVAASPLLCGAVGLDTPTTGPLVKMQTLVVAQPVPDKARRGLLEVVQPVRWGKDVRCWYCLKWHRDVQMCKELGYWQIYMSLGPVYNQHVGSWAFNTLSVNIWLNPDKTGKSLQPYFYVGFLVK